MNTEINRIIESMKEAWDGDPWFGRNIKSLLREVKPEQSLQKPQGQHSMLELLWHMINWKEFVLSRLRQDKSFPLHYFENNDWKALDHEDAALWDKGMEKFESLHHELCMELLLHNDDLLEKTVKERKYYFRKLLNGIIQHDVYHAGQIVYVNKLLKK
jgi:uncharacterized damage-inducible protein DinB